MGLFGKLFGGVSNEGTFSEDETAAPSKFKVVIKYPGGTSEEEDELFDTEEAANEAGMYAISCVAQGSEILNMSNPGDYPLNDEAADFEVIEVFEG